MGLLPDTKNGKIQWFENHIAPFETNAVAIGTTVLTVEDLETKTLAARAAYAAQQAAQDVAKARTLDLKLAIDVMVNAGMAIVEQVRTKARSAGDGVFALAQIPAPPTPTPIAPPGTPYQFAVGLKPNGALELKWKCNNPDGSQGTIYQLGRKIDGAAEFTYIGGVGEKTFTDNTLPAGSASVVYQLQAVRSTAIGDSAEFIVNIGVSGGTMTATVVSAKLAA